MLCTLGSHVTLDRCQLCGNSYCQLHPRTSFGRLFSFHASSLISPTLLAVPSFNNPTTSSHLPSSDDPDQPSCMFCGDHECTSRKVRESLLKPSITTDVFACAQSRSPQEIEVIDEPCLDGLAKDYPQLNICTAALIVDCSVEAVRLS